MKTLIKNGNVVYFDKVEKADILIEDGLIAKIDSFIQDSADEVIDASNKCVMAGFVDMHVHLREPGFENKETIETGTKAAVKGGFTAVACMPNTKPVLDNKFALKYVIDTANEAGLAKVYPICSITKGEEGELLSDMLTLKDNGAVAFSDDGKPVKTEEVGELIVKGDGVMKCYYKNPEATAEILKDGWLYTGDMAKRDADGFIYLVDRKKDVIITGGENLYPVQIEDFLRRNDKIKDVAVIGLPHERLGEIAAAIIEIKEDMSCTEDEINEFCLELPRYKRPRKIIFAKVPRNPTGKIEKPKLREMYCGRSLVEAQTTK